MVTLTSTAVILDEFNAVTMNPSNKITILTLIYDGANFHPDILILRQHYTSARRFSREQKQSYVRLDGMLIMNEMFLLEQGYTIPKMLGLGNIKGFRGTRV